MPNAGFYHGDDGGGGDEEGGGFLSLLPCRFFSLIVES